MTYNLYFHNLPSLESRCTTLGIKCEPFLSTSTTHCVVLSKIKTCPKLLSKVTAVQAKLITASACIKWMSDIKAKSPPLRPKPSATLKPTKQEAPLPTIKPDIIITDFAKSYRPVYQAKDDVTIYPHYPCDGSPFAKNMAPLAEADSAPPQLAANRKMFCENCGVSVKDLQEHLGTLQHRRFAYKSTNFSEIDAVIGDLTLDSLFGNKRRKTSS